MADYNIFFKESVDKDLRHIPKREIEIIFRKIWALAADPRPSGCEKLTGREMYRIRQGVYRILYTIQDDKLTICVVKVGHRKEVYR
jgi:mRNA interferase RelE/StbE